MTFILESTGEMFFELPYAGAPVTVYGASSEEKPIDVADGSVFIETDSQKTYMRDKKNAQWRVW